MQASAFDDWHMSCAAVVNLCCLFRVSLTAFPFLLITNMRITVLRRFTAGAPGSPEVGCKVVRKTRADEKIGVFAKVNGSVSVLEYDFHICRLHPSGHMLAVISTI